MMFKFISYGISCLIGTYISLNYLKIMFIPKIHKKYQNIIIGIPFALLWFQINLLDMPFVNFLYFMAACLTVGCVFYKFHIKEIFQTLIFNICYASCDIVISSLFTIASSKSIFYENKNSYLFLFDVILVEGIMLCLYNLLIILLRSYKSNCFNVRQILFLLALSLFNIIILFIISIAARSYHDVKTKYLILSMGIISIILNLITTCFFDYISKTNKLENDLALMRQRSQLQYNYYKNLEIKNNNMQKILHDIRHHLDVINQLYNKNVESGIKYSKKINKMLEDYIPKFKSTNCILNIIINEKINICQSKNIIFDYSVENTDLSFLDDIDITSIFANLLDNAIEACERINEGLRHIELHVYTYNKMLVIDISNSILEPPKNINGKYVSSKKHHEAMGLSNIKLIVNKYEGDIKIYTEQSKFFVSIIFPMQD